MTKVSNKALGARFERDLMQILSREGFWVTFLNPSYAGQAADLLAVRNGKPFLLDAKVMASRSFPLSRVEVNQWQSMEKFTKKGGFAGFVIRTQAGDYVMPYSIMCACDLACKSINLTDIMSYSIPLEKFMKGVKE